LCFFIEEEKVSSLSLDLTSEKFDDLFGVFIGAAGLGFELEVLVEKLGFANESIIFLKFLNS